MKNGHAIAAAALIDSSYGRGAAAAEDADARRQRGLPPERELGREEQIDVGLACAGITNAPSVLFRSRVSWWLMDRVVLFQLTRGPLNAGIIAPGSGQDSLRREQAGRADDNTSAAFGV